MRGTERRLAIIKQIQEHGHAEVNELAEKYQVSSMTIRRDLAKLEEEGLVIQEYGGAVLNSGSLFEYTMTMKQCEYQTEKERIAKACLPYINEGDTIFLDAGTTVCELAKLIAPLKNITVLTNSLLAANTLSGSDLEIIMCPGQFRQKSMAYLGSLTENFLSAFQIDKLFLGTEGVQLSSGISVPDITDGLTKRCLIEHAKWTACLADSSKLEKTFFYNICKMEKLDLFITNKELPEKYVSAYEENEKIILV